MATYYISPTGNNGNPGTIGSPWATLQYAMSNVVAGDTVYLRGGTYAVTSAQGITSNPGLVGTALNPICFYNYPGEVPIIDGSTKSSQSHGITLYNSSFVKFRGIQVRNHAQFNTDDFPSAFNLYYCADLTFDQCVVSDIGGRGFAGRWCSRLTFINCDAYEINNPLSATPGGDGDGFFLSPSYHNFTGQHYFYGCRAWRCSDDGWDIENLGLIVVQNCWAFNNGFVENPSSGLGNGFKLNLSPAENVSQLSRIFTNNVAAYNRRTGITTNDNGNGARWMHIYNNTSYANGLFGEDGYGFQVYNTGSSDANEEYRIFRNNIAYANTTLNFRLATGAACTQDHNSWNGGVTVTDADFVSVNSAGLDGARQEDGSLPRLDFLKLATGSDLINAGINVGLPFSGAAPDLGAFELNSIYFLAPTGNDITGNGSLLSPWFTLEKAWTVILPGDTLYMRGGTYEYLQTQTLAGVSGTLGNTIKIYNYPGEVPIIRKHASWVHVGWYYGVFFQSCSYIEVKGIRVTNFKYQQTSPCRGIMAQHVSNGLFENLACYDNELGMMLTGNSGNNLILNCDFYNNHDPFSPIPYGNSDGLDVSSIPNAYNNIVRGCRAWNNGDDGFDFWASEGIVTVQNCWAWSNGYREDGVTTGGDGNGFKLGQVSQAIATTRRYLYNCIAALNRVNNFSQNIVTPQVLTCELYNCLSYGAVSYSGYQFNWGAEAAQNSIMRNNISYADIYAARLSAFITNDHNSWNSGFTVSAADFVSLNHYQLSSARAADGSLPPILFGTLVSGSSLINAGIDVGLPFTGAAPDLGAFEFAGIPTVRKYETIIDYSIPTMPLRVTGIPSWLTVWNDTDSVAVLEGETIMPATTLLLYPNSQNNGSQRKGTIHIKDFIPIENDVALAVKQNGGPTMSTIEVISNTGETHLAIDAYTTSNAYGSNLVIFSCTPKHSQFAAGVALNLRIEIWRSGMLVYGSTPRYLSMNNMESNGPFSINMTSASVLADNILILLWTEPLN